MKLCGLVHSILVTTPVTVTGLFASYSAPNEWWARSGVVQQVRATASTPNSKRGRPISHLGLPVYSRQPIGYSKPKANRTLPELLPVTAYPEPMNTMPPAIVGPIELMAPPLAGTLFTVSNEREVSYSQMTLPSSVESACSFPSEPPTKATPAIADVAAELLTRVPALASGVYHSFSPVASCTATMPPRLRP